MSIPFREFMRNSGRLARRNSQIGHPNPFAVWGAGTAFEFRARGLQTALLQAPSAVAAAAGCEYAVVVTQGRNNLPAQL